MLKTNKMKEKLVYIRKKQYLCSRFWLHESNLTIKSIEELVF